MKQENCMNFLCHGLAAMVLLLVNAFLDFEVSSWLASTLVR